MKKGYIGICVIGTGRAGLIHARNFIKNIKFAELVALVDSNETSLNQASKDLGVSNIYADYKNAISSNKDIDAVVITTPTHSHHEIALFAASHGKHILCEKPMAMNEKECEDIIIAAHRNKVKLQIGFMRRYDKSFLAAKERILNGEIGDVIQVKSITHGPSIPKPWQYDIKKSNGPLAEVNSHDIDTLRWFTENEFNQVYAIAGNYRCPDAKLDFPDFYDNVSLISSFQNGMQGFIGGAVSVAYGYDSRVEIVGSSGVIFLGSLNENRVIRCNKNSGMNRSIVKSWMNLYEDAYLEEDKDFIRCILDDDQPKATGEDGKMAVIVVNAGNLSITEKRPIVLEL
ncbi:MAG TPA: oxidoreductase [Arenibacter sp.]|nr:oxidoreductase [Arenibacter sp.]|tara:strand:+ start:1610 stop:2638 length:1029 start_codon:yes stop_codon:yes gene_type:complete